MFEHALRAGTIGALRLSNRIIMGSMHLGLESRPGAALAAFYAERARGEAGLIITGGSAVSRVGAGGRHYSFINEPDDASRLHRVVRAVHDAAGRIALQLFHAGRYGSDRYFGLQPLAPTAVPSRFSDAVARAMTADDIAQTIGDFAAGARRAREIGFDAVEVMGSEGYLLNQFVSPLTNQRADSWGGDFGRRVRFPREVLRAIRAAVGRDYPVIYRLSGTDLMPGSTSEDETDAFARLLAGDGVDALDVGIGWHESHTPTVQGSVPPGFWVPQAVRIKRAVGKLPVIASTRIPTPELAEQVLAIHHLDFVAMARPFLADARIVIKARHGERINPCIVCNQACIERSLHDQPVSCMVNPRAGHELALPEPIAAAVPQSRRGSFVVIGGGPAGMEAARVFAALGQRVALYEAERSLGGQFRLARRIPGKEDFGRSIDYFEHELRRLGVGLHLEQRIDVIALMALTSQQHCDGVVLACGVVPRSIELAGVQLPQVCSYVQALSDDAVDSGPIAIIGAGGIGVDVAHRFSQQGRTVTLMCRGDIIGEHIGRSTRWVVMQSLRAHGVQLLTGVSYERIVPDGVWIRDRAERRLIPAQRVVIAAGQMSQSLAGTVWAGRAPVQLPCAYRIVGGARTASGLDAVRAFREGALAAHGLVTQWRARD